MIFSLLINMKMPTIVGIFIFISRENFMLSWVEHEERCGRGSWLHWFSLLCYVFTTIIVCLLLWLLTGNVLWQWHLMDVFLLCVSINKSYQTVARSHKATVTVQQPPKAPKIINKVNQEMPQLRSLVFQRHWKKKRWGKQTMTRQSYTVEITEIQTTKECNRITSLECQQQQLL